MLTKKIGTVDRNADEAALRDVWYARVLLEQGHRIPIKVDLSDIATAGPNRPHGKTKFLPRLSLRSTALNPPSLRVLLNSRGCVSSAGYSRAMMFCLRA